MKDADLERTTTRGVYRASRSAHECYNGLCDLSQLAVAD
jgi:hypothetical protein